MKRGRVNLGRPGDNWTTKPATWAFGYPAKDQREYWRPSVAGNKEHARWRTNVRDLTLVPSLALHTRRAIIDLLAIDFQV